MILTTIFNNMYLLYNLVIQNKNICTKSIEDMIKLYNKIP